MERAVAVSGSGTVMAASLVKHSISGANRRRKMRGRLIS